ALLFWNSHYVANGEQQVPMRVLVESDRPLAPQDALRELASLRPVDNYETHLSGAALWFSVASRGAPGDGDYIEFPSRHALAIRCWDPLSLQPLGSADRGQAEG